MRKKLLTIKGLFINFSFRVRHKKKKLKKWVILNIAAETKK